MEIINRTRIFAVPQIQLKTEETKPISSFFPKKGVTCERETNPQVKKECEDPITTNQGKSVKETLETQESTGGHFPEKISEDSKDDVSAVACEGERNFQAKRDYEKFSADAKPPDRKTDMPSTSSKKKKGSARGAGDKQATLFSYFGKG